MISYHPANHVRYKFMINQWHVYHCEHYSRKFYLVLGSFLFRPTVASVAYVFALFTPGAWLFLFRSMKASVSSASNLVDILNGFVFEFFYPEQQGNANLTTNY